VEALGHGDLERVDGRAQVTLVEPSDGRGVALWVDDHHRWLQIFTPPADGPRPALAVEPMTAPADAFNSGRSLRRLAPDETWTLDWGVDLVG
jgi:aldose 1-epimerase